MAHALRDFISVGVPHRLIAAQVSVDLLTEFGLQPGICSQLNGKTAQRLQDVLKESGSAEAGPGARLAVQLSVRGSRVGVLDLGQQHDALRLFHFGDAGSAKPVEVFQRLPSTAAACRFILSVPGRPAAHAIHYGSISAALTAESSLMARSASILCIEDRVWDVPGGAEYAAKISHLARVSGRSTMLLFSDADCSFRNRASLKAFATSHTDLIAGESQAALMAFGLQRLDSFIPQMKHQGKKAVLKRATHEPLVLDGTVRQRPTLPVRTHDAYFWNSFLPACIEEFAKTGQLDSASDERDQGEEGLPSSARS